MTSTLDQLMYGDSWRAADASGKRVELYGPWGRALRPTERRRFPAADLKRVRAAMREEGHEPLGFLLYGPVVLAATLGIVSIASIPDTVRWVVGVGGVVAAGVLVLNGTLGVPAAPAAFAKAMVREGRCPACAAALGAEESGRAVCTSAACGRAWRVPRPVAAVRERAEWACVDDRGRDTKLFKPGGWDQQADERFAAEFKSIQRMALGGSRKAAWASAGFLFLMAAQQTFRAMDQVIDHDYMSAAAWGAVAVLLIGVGIRSARWSVGGSAPKFVSAMLAHGRCPTCTYDLRGCQADAADGCTLCPECGAAWRLGQPAPGDDLQAAR